MNYELNIYFVRLLGPVDRILLKVRKKKKNKNKTKAKNNNVCGLFNRKQRSWSE